MAHGRHISRVREDHFESEESPWRRSLLGGLRSLPSTSMEFSGFSNVDVRRCSSTVARYDVAKVISVRESVPSSLAHQCKRIRLNLLVLRASASAVAFGMGLFSCKWSLGQGHHRAFSVISERRKSGKVWNLMLRRLGSLF